MRRKVCAAIAFLCFLSLLGFVGANEYSNIGFAEIVAQGLPRVAVMGVSMKIGGFNK